MKVAPLLAEFFYSNKRLDLPGIGSFLLDSSVYPDPDFSKGGRSIPAEGISFSGNPGLKESPELISYIAENTGKIKALAAADLESHLELAKQFLNIGKPFLFEGIGSLTKLQSGSFSFTPGVIIPEKANPRMIKETVMANAEEEQSGGFRSIFYSRKSKTGGRKIFIIGLLLAGIVLAVWGGYKVYKRSTSGNNDNESAGQTEQQTETRPVTSADTSNNHADTAVQQTNNPVTNPPVTAATGSYKFVVETADKTRGLARYNKLKGFGLNINMETNDSVTFKLYFILPAAAADTTRLVDSLRRLYTPAGNKAYVVN